MRTVCAKPAVAIFLFATALCQTCVLRAADGLVAFEVVGDAIPAPLGGLSGDPARGLALIRDRRVGNCLICHRLNLPDEPFQGEIGPALEGVGSRLSPEQIRLRLVDQSRITPDTIMPPYYRVAGLVNVAPEYQGRPALDAQQIEDMVVYLAGLKD
jgi:L-cysteine S-thiosulfotransferase